MFRKPYVALSHFLKPHLIYLNVHNILRRKSEWERPLGRPTCMWEDIVTGRGVTVRRDLDWLFGFTALIQSTLNYK
jgi:hypothetical protein